MCLIQCIIIWEGSGGLLKLDSLTCPASCTLRPKQQKKKKRYFDGHNSVFACEALLRSVLHNSAIVDDDKAAEGPGQRLNASKVKSSVTL